MFQKYQDGILVTIYFTAYKRKVSDMLIYQITWTTNICFLPLNALITTDNTGAAAEYWFSLYIKIDNFYLQKL